MTPDKGGWCFQDLSALPGKKYHYRLEVADGRGGIERTPSVPAK